MTRELTYVAAYVVAVYLGRATLLRDSQLALVWPAAAVAFLWVASAWHRPRARLLDIVGLLVLTVVLNVATGAPWDLALVAGAANVVNAVVAAWVFIRLRPQGWRLRDPGDLGALLVAASAGAAASVLIGPVGLWALGDADLGVTAGRWFLRNAVSTSVVAAVGLRLWPGRSSPAVATAGGTEVAAIVAFSVGIHVLVLWSVSLPLAFLLVPVGVWVGLRLRTTAATVHVLVSAAVFVTLTMLDRGPFAASSLTTRVVLAQAFIGVVGALTLMLALYRDQRELLVARLRIVNETVSEQATLLDAVVNAIDDGVVVLGGDGAVVRRNPAARALPRPHLAAIIGARSAATVRGPDGRLLTPEQLPSLAALRGRPVTGTDLTVEPPGADDGRVFHVNARPLERSGSHPGAVVAIHDVTDVRRAAEQTAAARDLFAGVLAAATEQSIIGTDRGGRITVFNAGAERMLGWPADEVIGTSMLRFHDDAELVQRTNELHVSDRFEALVHGATRDAPETRRWTYRTRDGSVLQVTVAITAMRDGARNVAGYISVATDVTEQLTAEQALHESEQRFRLAFETAPVAMALVELDVRRRGRMLRVNPAMCRFSGLAERKLLDRDLQSLTHPGDRGRVEAWLAAFGPAGGPTSPLEDRYLRADGTTVWGAAAGSVAAPAGEPPYLIVIIDDITARKDAEAALTHQALHDPLTGLANRTLLADRLEHALAEGARSLRDVGVLYVDLDDFKAINDAAGHAAGDEVLIDVAARLACSVRPSDTVARLGGDEFVVVCPDTDEAELASVADRVMASLAEPVTLSAGVFPLAASIGIRLSSPECTAQQLLRDADEAMYSAKRQGRGRIVRYDTLTVADILRTIS